jgi:peptidoglycan/LPS O-acetylase OafA/YrhL
VLSGFLVGRTVLRPVWSKTWSLKRYLVHRLTRLEVVLIPALILCWILDATGIHIFRSSPVYMGTAGLVVLPYNVAETLNLHVFFGNIAFLQTVFVHTFGSDDPLWSLTNEFWYYILFPCIAICLAGEFGRIKRIIALTLLIGLFALFWIRPGNNILGGFVVWLFGAALAVLPPPRWLATKYHSLAIAVAIALVVLQLMMTYIPFVIETNWDQDYILGALFAGLMYVSLHDPRPVSDHYRRTAKYAAGMSYTLYVTHMHVLVFIAAWLGGRWLPDSRHLIIASGILCIPIAYAIAVSMLFERNTDRVRKKIEAIVGLYR